MSRIQAIDPTTAGPDIEPILASLKKSIGRIPNIFLNMGQSAAVLKGYADLTEAIHKTSLNSKLREQIALVVSQANSCNYCLSAHTVMAKGAGLSEESIIEARKGESQDQKSAAVLKFAKKVAENRGHVSDQDVEHLKEAGVNDKELAEIVLVVIQTMFTNYFNNVTDPQIDFPLAPSL